MPRDSSGNYTLPIGNPVVDGTVIDVNWANPTMSDIAVQLNNVLTRDGLLSPIDPFYIVDGTEALPGLAFNSQHGTGWWRDATQVGFSYQGTALFKANASGVTFGTNKNLTFTGTGGITLGLGSIVSSSVEPLKFKRSNGSYIGWYDDTFGTVKSYIQAIAVDSVLKLAGEGGLELNIGGNGVAVRLIGTSWAPTVDISAYLGEGSRRWSNLFTKELTPSDTITFNDATGLIRKSNSSGNVVVTGENALVNDSARTSWHGSSSPSRSRCIDHSANTHLFTAANYSVTMASLDYSLTENGCIGLRVGGGDDAFAEANRGYIAINGADSVLGMQVGGATIGYLYAQGGQMSLLTVGARALVVGANGGECFRITDTNYLRVGDTTMTGSGHVIAVTGGAGTAILNVSTLTNGATFFYGGDSSAFNAANAVQKVWSLSGRSINAAGTLNASGADYAEYEDNNGLDIAKGAIVGFTATGLLTLTFDEAVRFGIKSTDPSFVGGDTWGTDLEGDALAAAQARVDRVAYSGKVPVNVFGAIPGGYVVAMRGASGNIEGLCVADIDFVQYTQAVGRVNKVLPDGRAEVAVIVH